MKANNVVVLYSDDFRQLSSFFNSIDSPYNLEHIAGFNAIYRRIFQALNQEEKRRAEEFVEVLIENVERKEWATKIFGVV
jgi:hypothetical protein